MEDDDFQTLIEFLSRCQSEAMGRGSLSAPHTEDAARLLRFASGRCSEEERFLICAQLRMHPAWLRWLADRVRAAKALTGVDSYSQSQSQSQQAA